MTKAQRQKVKIAKTFPIQFSDNPLKEMPNKLNVISFLEV